LQAELCKERLYNKLLNTMIDLAEEQLEYEKIWSQTVLSVKQSEKRCLLSLCSLFGYSRQAYYQHQRSIEKEASQSELVLQEVLRIRRQHKRIGTRKLLFYDEWVYA